MLEVGMQVHVPFGRSQSLDSGNCSWSLESQSDVDVADEDLKREVFECWTFLPVLEEQLWLAEELRRSQFFLTRFLF